MQGFCAYCTPVCLRAGKDVQAVGAAIRGFLTGIDITAFKLFVQADIQCVARFAQFSAWSLVHLGCWRDSSPSQLNLTPVEGNLALQRQPQHDLSQPWDA